MIEYNGKMRNMKGAEGKIAVLYHAECSDGFGAAFSAWKKFGKKALYLPVYHQTNFPAEAEGADVFMVDFAYPPEVLKSLKEKIKSLTIIDHHLSAKDSVALADNKIYDMNHSGSVLAWKYFHPDEKVPKLLEYIEDQDIWKFELPDSREINRAIDQFYDYDFKIWEKMLADFEHPKKLEKYKEEGAVLVKVEDKRIEKIIGDAEEVVFEGIKCLAANSPILNSFIGAKLVKKMPPMGIIWHRKKDRIRVSLRGDGTVDLSVIAQKYGGGGHKSAAGFYVDGITFEKLIGLRK